MQKIPTTDELIAQKYPHLSRSLLERMDERLAAAKKENGGTIELCIRFTDGIAQWFDSKQRELLK